MKSMADRKFSDFKEFFLFYLTQHSDARNRALHATGTVSGVLFAASVFLVGKPWYALLWPVIAYGFAWTGHFLVEHNKPATFGHPFWSFISDFRMVYLMFTGQLNAQMEVARSREAALSTGISR
jgi:hypothetical protein